KLLANAVEFRAVFLVGVFPHRESLLIRVIAGIDAYFLDPFRRLQSGFGLEMNVRDQRDLAMASPQPGGDLLKIRGILDRWRGDPNDLASNADEIERLGDRLLRVHRVASDHRLDANGIVAADTDSSHPYLARSAPRVRKWAM